MEKIFIQGVCPCSVYDYPPGTKLDILINQEGIVEVSTTDYKLQPIGAKIIDGNNLLISPGWIDLHTHCYWGANNLSVFPSDIGLKTGVATLVDAGTAGEASFAGFRDFIIKQSKEKIFSFLNLSSFGLVAVDLASEFQAGWRSFNLKRVSKLIEENRDFIKGIKIRCSGYIMHELGVSFLKIAKKLAQVHCLPLMVHIGEAPPTPEEILDCLTEGDIITHCFHGKAVCNIAVNDSIIQKAKMCKERGIYFDIGHGLASFSVDVCKKMISEEIFPDTISTDLHQRSIKKFVYDLPTVMSKLLSIGMSSSKILEAVTQTPAKILNLPNLKNINPGDKANFTLFSMINKSLELQDSEGKIMKIKQIFNPEFTVQGENWSESESYLKKNIPPIFDHSNLF